MVIDIKRLLAHRKLIKSRKPRFRRTDWHKISNLGLRREKKQVYRNPRGRHNKMREKRNGRLGIPSIGYGSPRAVRGTIEGYIPILIHNVKELENVSKNNIVIVASVGMKKKMEIVKKAVELKMRIAMNAEKFLKISERKVIMFKAKKVEKKEEKEKKKKVQAEKPAKEEKLEKKQEEKEEQKLEEKIENKTEEVKT
ncbi:MAG: eL32 family ribosomal protein [archaeon]